MLFGSLVIPRVRICIWIDIEPWEHTQKDTRSFPVSKRMIALLRHGSFPRDEDGAIKIWRSKMEFRSVIPSSENWSIRLWIDHLQKEGDVRRNFSIVLILLENNSLPPSHPRSFGRISCGSVFAGQRIRSRQFLRVHLSCRMLLQYTLYRRVRIDSGTQKFW